MKNSQVAAAAIGVGLLLLVLSSERADAAEGSAEKPLDQVKPDQAAAESDPLPEYPLTQPNVIAAVVEFIENGQTSKVTSVVVKSLTGPAAMRAYVVAALASVPAQLKADLEFIRQFEKDEAKRLAAVEAINDRNNAIIRATETVVVTVVTKVNAVAGAVVAIGVALGEAARTIVTKMVGLPKRSAAEQIYPLREGYGLRRGVLFQPNLPYVTRGEIELADKVRSRWLAEASVSAWFQSLPELPQDTELRFAPRWDDYAAAVKKLQDKGIEL